MIVLRKICNGFIGWSAKTWCWWCSKNSCFRAWHREGRWGDEKTTILLEADTISYFMVTPPSTIPVIV